MKVRAVGLMTICSLLRKRRSSSCFFLSLVFLQHIVLGPWVAFCVPERGLANLGISGPVIESLVGQEVPLLC